MEQSEAKFNLAFAKSRNISEQTMVAMNEVYIRLEHVLARPNMFCESPEEAVEVVKAFEITLQSFWGFPFDSSFHNRWFELNGCSCPVMDNRERSGTPYQIITCSCPYHGNDKADTWDDRRFKS